MSLMSSGEVVRGGVGGDIEAVEVEPGGTGEDVVAVHAVCERDHVDHGGVVQEVAVAVQPAAGEVRSGGLGAYVDIGKIECGCGCGCSV
jgi:hypothetical protein